MKVLFIFIGVLACVILFNINELKKLNLVSGQQTIQYKIGRIDPEFKISEQELKYLAYEATQIWEKPLNQILFEYHPKAKLAINLLYDERQQNSEYVDRLNQTMDQKDQELQRMKVRLDQQLERLQARKNEIENTYRTLRSERSQWSMVEFSSGENIQRIDQQIRKLDQQRDQLMSDWDSYHLNVKLYNQKIEDFNQYAHQAREYNQANALRSFHKGTYSGDRIDVYQFSNKNDLKVTLAHEFGHALGLSHHQEPKALMYPMLDQQDIDQFQLQPADVALFQQTRN